MLVISGGEHVLPSACVDLLLIVSLVCLALLSFENTFLKMYFGLRVLCHTVFNKSFKIVAAIASLEVFALLAVLSG